MTCITTHAHTHARHARTPLACGSPGQVEAVGVVHLGTAGLLAGHDLTGVPAVEALVLPLLGELRLALLLHGELLLALPQLEFLRRRLVLQGQG